MPISSASAVMVTWTGCCSNQRLSGFPDAISWPPSCVDSAHCNNYVLVNQPQRKTDDQLHLLAQCARRSQGSAYPRIRDHRNARAGFLQDKGPEAGGDL